MHTKLSILSHVGNPGLALKACNYTTGMVGKWHLSDTTDGGSYGDPYTTQQVKPDPDPDPDPDPEPALTCNLDCDPKPK